MKRIALAAVLTTALSSCFAHYGPNVAIDIDSHKIMVSEVTSARNTWYAYEVGSGFRPGEAERYSRNVVAIEKHTGCQVDLTSIENTSGHTTALVICR